MGIAKYLPPVQICVQDGSQKWLSNGLWSHTDNSHDFTDLQTALIPFLRLLRCDASITLPKELCEVNGDSNSGDEKRSGDYRGSSISNESDSYRFERLKTLVKDITSETRLKHARYAKFMQQFRHLQLHRLLGNLPGPTASILGRERFANRHNRYEIYHHRGLHDILFKSELLEDRLEERWGDSILDQIPDIDEADKYCDEFEKLYLEMRAWNQWSWILFKKPNASDDKELWLLYEKMVDMGRRRNDCFDGFHVGSWARCYPEGIRLENSPEYHHHVETSAASHCKYGILLDTVGDRILRVLGGRGALNYTRKYYLEGMGGLLFESDHKRDSPKDRDCSCT
jgi:hypothetical protein